MITKDDMIRAELSFLDGKLSICKTFPLAFRALQILLALGARMNPNG
jgi:hypothetical protein